MLPRLWEGSDICPAQWTDGVLTMEITQYHILKSRLKARNRTSLFNKLMVNSTVTPTMIILNPCFLRKVDRASVPCGADFVAPRRRERGNVTRQQLVFTSLTHFFTSNSPLISNFVFDSTTSQRVFQTTCSLATWPAASIRPHNAKPEP